MHPCTGAYTVHIRPHTLRYTGYRARLRYCEFPRMSLLGDWVNRGLRSLIGRGGGRALALVEAKY